MLLPNTGELSPNEKLAHHPVTLSQASDPQYFGRFLQFEALVVGKETVPFSAARTVSSTCPTKKCQACPYKELGGQGMAYFEGWDPKILELIECTHEQRDLILRRVLNMPIPCRTPELKIEETHFVELIRVSPVYDWHIQAEDNEYIMRNLYVIGKPIKTNQTYLFRGVTIPHPKNQIVTHLVYDAEPIEHSIDNFTLTPEMKESFKLFQTDDTDDAVSEKLEAIYDDFTYNVTKRYNRQDLLMAVDLVYHSPLQFFYDGRLNKRGWMECLVLGDTQCGKTDSVEALLTHYRLGEKILAENASFAGLVGGVQQIGQRWQLQWGKLPLNDRRLLVIDELSGFNPDDLAKMSGIRSDGKAEVTKIQSFQTSARTRIVWITNPKTGRKLTQYSYGVNAIKELFTQPEDIARIDLFVTATEADFDLRELHNHQKKRIKHVFTSELCRNLVLFVWSRKADATTFTEEAKEEILRESLLMRERYDSTIPLILENAQHLRFQRVSAAIAARLYSVDETGEKIVVKPVHVRAAGRFMRQLFDKPSMGYNLFSLQGRSSDTHIKDKQDSIQWFFKSFNKWEKLRDHMLKNEILKPGVIKMMMGYKEGDVDALFSWMNDHHLIFATKHGYVKHRLFTEMLKKLIASYDEAKLEAIPEAGENPPQEDSDDQRPRTIQGNPPDIALRAFGGGSDTGGSDPGSDSDGAGDSPQEV